MNKELEQEYKDILIEIDQKRRRLQEAHLCPKSVLLDLRTYNLLRNANMKFTYQYMSAPIWVADCDLNAKIEVSDGYIDYRCSELNKVETVFGLKVLIIRANMKVIEVSI